jgi:hypothetical protein
LLPEVAPLLLEVFASLSPLLSVLQLLVVLEPLALLPSLAVSLSLLMASSLLLPAVPLSWLEALPLLSPLLSPLLPALALPLVSLSLLLDRRLLLLLPSPSPLLEQG